MAAIVSFSNNITKIVNIHADKKLRIRITNFALGLQELLFNHVGSHFFMHKFLYELTCLLAMEAIFLLFSCIISTINNF